MTNNEAVIAVIDALNELGIPYTLVGSYATNFYGVPRSTNTGLVRFVVVPSPS